MTDSSLSALFCECLLLWAWLQATRQGMQQDSLLCQPRLFCDRAWQVTRQAKAMQRSPLVKPWFELSCAYDVLRAKALLQAIRLEQATELA